MEELDDILDDMSKKIRKVSDKYLDLTIIKYLKFDNYDGLKEKALSFDPDNAFDLWKAFIKSLQKDLKKFIEKVLGQCISDFDFKKPYPKELYVNHYKLTVKKDTSKTLKKFEKVIHVFDECLMNLYNFMHDNSGWEGQINVVFDFLSNPLEGLKYLITNDTRYSDEEKKLLNELSKCARRIDSLYEILLKDIEESYKKTTTELIINLKKIGVE
ncbi:hypothetical protein [Kordia sp.]|uniref:hypothetical protein n=1 Tax=Kordia sp. TaxID=1965332 RepID=UPI003D6BF7A5